MHVPLPLMSTDDYICHASENNLASILMRAGDLMSTGHVYTLIGNGERGSHQADGRPLTSEPFGLATGPDGALYYCDLGNHKICRFIDGLSEKVVGRDMAATMAAVVSQKTRPLPNPMSYVSIVRAICGSWT